MAKNHKGPFRLYAVTLRRFEEHPIYVSARSRSGARYAAWLQSGFAEHSEFREFISWARVRLASGKFRFGTGDGYDYVRRYYGLQVRIGQRVRLKGSDQQGVVTYPGGTTNYVHVGIDGYAAPVPVHPHYIEIEEPVA